MEKGEKFQKEKIGKPECINKNCWLVKSLNYAPYKRCQYCELKFHDCLFLHYQIISLILISLSFLLSFLIKGKISELVVISVFSLVIVYGYFFSKSTDKIIQAYSAQRKAREDLEKLTETLQEKVDEQTKAIKDAYKKVKKAYEVEKQVHQELKRINEAKSQFLMATQHHLRTPLTAIKGFLSMAMEGDFGKINEALKEKLNFCFTSANRLIKLVNEFLDISKLQLGKDILELKEVSLVDLLQEAVDEVKPEADKKGIYLNLENHWGAEPLKITADPSKLKEALYNIIDNAVKYTEKGGVTVKLQMTNDKLQIVIQDTGIGMSPEEAKNIFGRQFERGKEAKKVYSLGRGIGLFLAASIIREHKGNVWVESPGPGKGSTFYVELPRKR